MLNRSDFRRWPGFVAVLALASLFLVGCGDDDPAKPIPPGLEPPAALTGVNGDRLITLTWNASPSQTRDDFSRYNVYRSATSLLNTPTGELEAFRVHTVVKGQPNRADTGVENGILYFYHVRSELQGGQLSGPSNEVRAAGRDEGTNKTLMEFAGSGSSGFDFSTGESVNLAPGNPDRFSNADLYLGTVAADDSSSSPLQLKSPGLLPEAEWQDSQIKILGQDWDVSTTEDIGWSDQAAVVQGLVYAVKTPTGSFAKLQIQSIGGQAGSRTITFRYTHQPNADIHEF